MNLSLEKCPFCGSEKLKIDSKTTKAFNHDTLSKESIHTYSVRCNKCFARGGTAKTKEDAINKWNERR